MAPRSSIVYSLLNILIVHSFFRHCSKLSANASLCEHIHSRSVPAQPISFPAVERHSIPQSGSEEISEGRAERSVEVVAVMVSAVVEEAATKSRNVARIRRIRKAIVTLVYGERAWACRTAYD